MFDFSFAELLVVVLVALVVIGPEEMPTVARGILKTIRSVRHACASLRQQFLEIVDDEELRAVRQDVHAVQRGKHFILDDEGNYREAYDVSNLHELRAAHMGESVAQQEILAQESEKEKEQGDATTSS
jgi:Tat protein translocase TatB subunit